MSFTARRLLVRRLRAIFPIREEWLRLQDTPVFPQIWDAASKGFLFSIHRAKRRLVCLTIYPSEVTS